MIDLPEEESTQRIEALREYLIRTGMDCAFVFHNVDRFYYTGTMQDGVLLIHVNHDPVLFIRRTLSRAIEESTLRHVVGYRSLREIAEFMNDRDLTCRHAGTDMDILPAKLYVGLHKVFPDVDIIDISGVVRRQRAIKSVLELSLMEEAGRRFDHVLACMRDELRPGMSEYEAYIRFSQLLLKHRSSLLIRARMFNMEAEPRYILGGDSAANLSSIDSPNAAGSGISRAFPTGGGDKVLRAGEPILIDSVFVHEGYLVDCTRIYAFGELDTHFEKAHDLSRLCHDLFIEQVKPGTYIPDLYKSVLGFVEQKGMTDVFMGGVSFIGHGVGLELDEFPIISERFDDIIEEGMAIAFEPKFLFPGGTVGYENTYRILGDGVESLNRMDETIQYL
jgi:Xaa-Pro aminopeptidase